MSKMNNIESVPFFKTFTVRFCYHDTMAEDVVQCEVDTLIFEAVRRVLQKDEENFKVTDDYIVEGFIIKILGTNEVIFKNHPITKFLTPLEDLKCKREPRFILIPSGILRPKILNFTQSLKVCKQFFI